MAPEEVSWNSSEALTKYPKDKIALLAWGICRPQQSDRDRQHDTCSDPCKSPADIIKRRTTEVSGALFGGERLVAHCRANPDTVSADSACFLAS